MAISKILGTLSYSVALGSVLYFSVCSPFGRLDGVKILGIQNIYLGGPKAVIPKTIVVAIVLAIILCGVLGIVLDSHGY